MSFGVIGYLTKDRALGSSKNCGGVCGKGGRLSSKHKRFHQSCRKGRKRLCGNNIESC